MEFGQWLSLFGVCLLGAMSPGPSLAVVVQSTLGGGRGAGVAAALAHGLGVALYGLFTVTGLAVLIAGSVRLFTGIQLAGAAYLIYLGIGALRAGPAGPAQPEPGGSGRRAAASGFTVAFLNPKLAVFMLALFSQFLQPGAGWQQKGVMVLTVGLTDALWYCAVALLLSRRGLLDRLQAGSRVIDRVFGVVLILLGLTVIARAAGLL